MPRSRAIRRASGEALTRPSRRGSRISVTLSARSAAAARPRSRSGSRAGAIDGASTPTPDSAEPGGGSSGTGSPSAPTNAIVWPTGTSPSRTAIFSSTPSASASTSWVTLSVSSS